MADLYADRDIGRGVSLGLRALGHTVLMTEELGLDTATDDVQFLAAQRYRRIMLTHNRKDFRLLHNAWRGWTTYWGITQRHAGIVVPLQGWQPEREIAVIDTLLRQIESFENELYTWERDVQAWVRRL
jgi:hypothetical protein